jgi:hypothetical protein
MKRAHRRISVGFLTNRGSQVGALASGLLARDVKVRGLWSQPLKDILLV